VGHPADPRLAGAAPRRRLAGTMAGRRRGPGHRLARRHRRRRPAQAGQQENDDDLRGRLPLPGPRDPARLRVPRRLPVAGAVQVGARAAPPGPVRPVGAGRGRTGHAGPPRPRRGQGHHQDRAAHRPRHRPAHRRGHPRAPRVVLPGMEERRRRSLRRVGPPGPHRGAGSGNHAARQRAARPAAGRGTRRLLPDPVPAGPRRPGPLPQRARRGPGPRLGAEPGRQPGRPVLGRHRAPPAGHQLAPPAAGDRRGMEAAAAHLHRTRRHDAGTQALPGHPQPGPLLLPRHPGMGDGRPVLGAVGRAVPGPPHRADRDGKGPPQDRRADAPAGPRAAAAPAAARRQRRRAPHRHERAAPGGQRRPGRRGIHPRGHRLPAHAAQVLPARPHAPAPELRGHREHRHRPADRRHRQG
jgi:hypothetical protein